MSKKVMERHLYGVPYQEEREYEIRHRKTAREAAAQGMILLKNENHLLPLSKKEPVALYGAGAVKTIKGGTGSGDVNSRHTVSIREGLEAAGFQITTGAWLDAYEKEYEAARIAWRDDIMTRAGKDQDNGTMSPNFFLIYSSTPFQIPAGEIPAEKSADDTADTAIFVISRTAGEGSDRKCEPGDYLLTEKETTLLDAVCGLYEQVVLLLNTGGLIDLSFLDDPKHEKIRAILYTHQPGMEAGSAVADLLSGAVTPSGKLTDTWAYSYEDYPNASTFSYQSGDVSREEYGEGIYVGYRYFDTFSKPVRYCFGYGLSYTKFTIVPAGLEHFNLGTDHARIEASFRVTNTGSCTGREVVQLYVSCPQEGMEKEYRRLAGFQKTATLKPGEMQKIKISFSLYSLSSFDEAACRWVMEPGSYVLMAGNSLNDTAVCGVIKASDALIFAKTQHICPLQQELAIRSQNSETALIIELRRRGLLLEAEEENCPVLYVKNSDIVTKEFTYDGAYENTPEAVRNFVDTLTTEELILLSTGDISKGQGVSLIPEDEEQMASMEKEDAEGHASGQLGGAGTSVPGSAAQTVSMDAENEEGHASGQLGGAGTSVPGSAAQTTDCASYKGLGDIVLADGPAGIRLNQTYRVVDGAIQPEPFEAALENGFFVENSGKKELPEGELRYQYCTAFPVGTLLAQSWDPEVIRSVGCAVGGELLEFGITLWLAPGMCIHRNPLCGRNFEYYAEDPYLSGVCAAAMTEGVQSIPGVGTTIKHFACNNQEDNRMASDSILSERTLREIYLKGFELCVEKAQPFAIMTSYNLVNGIHAANNYDLCTKAARNEWGFEGLIMTDWTTTMVDDTCTASGCLRAGNDLIMPGAPSDHANIRKELAEGTLTMADLKRSAARTVNIIWKSNYTVDE